jgi:RNA polymerase sigma-70 factor (ECF subfamily)
VLTLLAVTGTATPLEGQDWSWSFHGGRVTHELSGSSPSEISGLLSLRYQDAGGSWGFLSTGVPFGDGDATWMAGGLGTRIHTDAGPIQLGLDVDGQAYGFRDPSLAQLGTGGVLGIRPLLAAGNRAARLEVRSGWAGYGSAIGASSFRRSVHDSDVRLHVYPVPWARLTGTVRHMRAQEGSYSFGGGQLALGFGRLQLWGGVGGWTSELLPTVPWNAGGSVALDQAGGTRIVMTARRDATDPLYWNTPRSRWSVGLTHTFGGRDTNPAPRSPRIVMSADGSIRQVEIRLPANEAEGQPSIAGAFNDWTPTPMIRDGEEWVTPSGPSRASGSCPSRLPVVGPTGWADSLPSWSSRRGVDPMFGSSATQEAGGTLHEDGAPPDSAVVRRVLAGCTDDFAILIRRYQDRFHRFALGMLNDHDAASDVVQESFVTVYSKLASCKNRHRFESWAFQILRNRCRDYLKNVRRSHQQLDARPSFISSIGLPEPDLEQSELRRTLRGALADLPEGHREAFLLKHLQGLTYDEIAERLGTSTSAAKMRVHRSREMLREALDPEHASTM